MGRKVPPSLASGRRAVRVSPQSFRGLAGSVCFSGFERKWQWGPRDPLAKAKRFRPVAISAAILGNGPNFPCFVHHNLLFIKALFRFCTKIPTA